MRSLKRTLMGCVIAMTMCAMASAAEHADKSPGATTRPAHARKGAKKEKSVPTSQPAAKGVYGFKLKTIDGEEKTLADYKGKVLLLVNVASKCGYTKQYTGLEALYEKYKDKGLVIVGFPSNDFGQQEPGTEKEIKEFCSTKFHVTFPMMEKSSVKNGPDQSPLYQYLSQKSKNGEFDAKVAWNFNKFLVDREGHVVKHYESKVTPESEQLKKDIEAALPK